MTLRDKHREIDTEILKTSIKLRVLNEQKKQIEKKIKAHYIHINNRGSNK